MLTIKHILFPVDFSDRTKATAPYVKFLAQKFGAEVTLMAVMPPISEMMVGGLVPDGGFTVNLEDLRDNLGARLQGALTAELAGIPVRRVAELGDPAQTITQFAQSEGVDLIAMATHGYGPFRALLLGSVAAKVLHDADCPVWTSVHTADPAVQNHLECRTILCAVDGTQKSGPLIEWAAEFAKICGAKFRVMHAVSSVEPWPERQMNREYELVLKQRAKEAIERQMKASSVEAPLEVLAGDVAAAVREEALRSHTDLVIIGRGLLDETLGRLRTHAYGIIRNSPCPVLSV